MRPLLTARARAWALSLAGVVVLGGCATRPAVADLPASATPPRLRLVVQAPAGLRALLEKHLDLARLQDLPADDAIDAAEWVRLIGAAPAQARDLLQTEGYFEAQVTVQRRSDSDSNSDAKGRPLQQVVMAVQPGPLTRVSRVQVDFQGPLQARQAAADADALALATPLAGAGVLQAGQPLRNRDWSDLKQQWLARLRAAGYASASLAQSLADVDVAGQSAALSLALDSGPLYRAGPLQIDGLKHHDAATVQHLAGFGPGAALTELFRAMSRTSST